MSSTSLALAHGGDDIFRAFLAAAPDGVVMVDGKGSILFFSAACERLFGYRENEVVGKSANAIVRASSDEKHFGHLPGFGEKGNPWQRSANRKVLGRRKDRSKFLLNMSVGEGIFEGQKIFVGVLRRPADREPDETIREREARLRSIVATIPDALVTIDEEGVVESFSASASNLFGYRAEEIVGKNIKVLIPTPFRELESSPSYFVHAGERTIPGNRRVVIGRRSDDSAFPMEIALGEIHREGKRFFTCFLRDVTHRPGTEQRLEDLQAELIHMSRLSAMGQMTAAIAHELNQPLAAISNFIRAAKRTLKSAHIDSNVKGPVEELIDKAAHQTLGTGAIIRNLREFVEKRTKSRRPENLNRIVEQSLALAFANAADRSVKVRLELDPTLAPVMVDKVQIQQVLINLIHNSIEAMFFSERHELVISTSPRDEAFAYVTVQDSGSGMSQDVAAHLFQPFVTSKKSGMGIELTICQSIIEAHGGRIRLLESTPTGTRFQFELPFATAAAINA